MKLEQQLKHLKKLEDVLQDGDTALENRREYLLPVIAVMRDLAFKVARLCPSDS